MLGLAAAGLIVLAAASHLVVIVFAIRAAVAGTQIVRIARALGISFGALVASVGLLTISFDLDLARAIGIAVALTGLAVVALSLPRGRRWG